jgi:acyl-coenzyme A synthetase/AMP-(fatty) acid ligase
VSIRRRPDRPTRPLRRVPQRQGVALTATFLSPARVDEARLREAMRRFNQARGDTDRSAGPKLDDEAWRTVAFTHKPDLRRDPCPYPETGKQIARLRSSGTTAEPVVTPWSEVDQQVGDAAVREIHARCPSIQGARCAVIAPDRTLAVTYFMWREIELNGGMPCLVKPGEPETIWRTLIDEGVEVVFTLPLVASRLAEYFYATRRRSPEGISVVFCGGDLLSSARQSMLAAMWDAPVLNMFGCSELFGPLAGPGEAGRPLVWGCEPVAVEVIDPDTKSPCGIGERGVLILTTLWPKARPLLRYWTDDLVEVIDTVAGGGAFSFDYIGRPPSMLQTGRGQLALRDIDHLLLSAGWCASEWLVRQTPAGVCFEVEMPGRTAAAARTVTEALVETVGGPVEFIPKEPGSLARVQPKFSVAHQL